MALASALLRRMHPRVRYELHVHARTPRRYRNLLKAIRAVRATSILEIGVCRGERSKQLIETAQLFSPGQSIRYDGFDLFEGLTDEVLKAEFSRRPSSEADVKAFLGRTGADIHLYQGFSQVTLPAFVEQWRERPFHIDLIFIDGGHAEETIREDWRNVEQLLGPGTIAIFDDYYPEDYSAHIGRAGCQYVVDSLDRARYDVSVLEPQDCFQNGWGELRINLARVTMRQVPVEGAPAPRR